jgi:hypothetical protein
MARDQEPVTDEEIEELREKMQAQREQVREDLAEDLGGEPADYDAQQFLMSERAQGRPMAEREIEDE